MVRKTTVLFVVAIIFLSLLVIGFAVSPPKENRRTLTVVSTQTTTITSTNTVTTTTTITSTITSSTLKVETIDLSGFQEEKLGFTKNFLLNPLNTSLEVMEYSLPLKSTEISNFLAFSKNLSLSQDASSLLEKNGFVVISDPFNPKEEDITTPYNQLRDREIPIFITTDSLLHLYHIQFDETLRQIEER
jgi:hypothetical protein